MKELQEYLQQQNKEFSEAQSKKEQEEERRRKAKKNKNKFSSFENSINRPPFFSATHIQQVFQEEGFIDKDVPALSQKDKETLIAPARNKNPEFCKAANYVSHLQGGPSDKQAGERHPDPEGRDDE